MSLPMLNIELEACSIWVAFDVVLWLVTAWQVSSSASNGADCTMSSKRSVGGHVQVHTRCILDACQVHTRCILDACQVHSSFIPGACQVHVRFMPGARFVKARCTPTYTKCIPGAH